MGGGGGHMLPSARLAAADLPPGGRASIDIATPHSLSHLRTKTLMPRPRLEHAPVMHRQPLSQAPHSRLQRRASPRSLLQRQAPCAGLQRRASPLCLQRWAPRPRLQRQAPRSTAAPPVAPAGHAGDGGAPALQQPPRQARLRRLPPRRRQRRQLVGRCWLGCHWRCWQACPQHQG